MINESSALVYRNIAVARRMLASNPDLSAEELRDMLVRALEACEILNQATDMLTTALNAAADRHTA